MVKVCKTCGIEKPATIEYFPSGKGCKDGIRGYCRACNNGKHKLYRDSNRERIAESERIYYTENKNKVTERNKKYVETHKKEVTERRKTYRDANKSHINGEGKKYYTEHRDDFAVKGKIYREANKEHISKHKREYAKENRPSCNINNHNYRARSRKLLHTLTEEQWRSVVNIFENTCAYCGEEKPLAQEHFYPMLHGGDYTVSNIICACKRCNGSKGAKSFFDWYPKQPYYSKSREKKILSYLKYKNNIQQLAFV